MVPMVKKCVPGGVHVHVCGVCVVQVSCVLYVQALPVVFVSVSSCSVFLFSVHFCVCVHVKL